MDRGVEEYMLVFYSIVCVIPATFLAYAFIHIVLHWKDGIQHGRVQFWKSQCTKRTLSGLLALGSVLNVAGGFTQLQNTDDRVALDVRSSFFSIQAVAWVFSYCLVPFNYNRRLHSPWYGQRLFIPLLGSIYIALCIIEGVIIDPHHLHFMFEVLQLVVYLINTLLAVAMTYIITARPDDFFHSKNLSVSLVRDAPASSTDFMPEDGSELLSVEISNVKTRMTSDQVPVVHYSITVKTNQMSATARRTYADFIEMHKTLEKKYNRMKLPKLPKFDATRDPVAQRMIALSNYLEAICLPELMGPELLDFLSVEEPLRAQVLELSRQLLFRKSSTGRRSTFICSSLPDQPFTSILTPYLVIKIDQWEDYDNYVRYFIKWEAPSAGLKGTAKLRYNDLYNMHNGLKSLIYPGVLPNFPSKSIFALGEDSITQRAKELQSYLSHITNDFAYLDKETLLFLGCDLQIEALWRRANFNTVKLMSMTWESVKTEESKFHIVYVILLEKEHGNVSWTLRRRYSQFFNLNKSLNERYSSPLLNPFLEATSQSRGTLPTLPKKTLTKLEDSDEIEVRRQGLEVYLSQLLVQPLVRLSYVFKEFLREP